jgi:hypothetical protein
MAAAFRESQRTEKAAQPTAATAAAAADGGQAEEELDTSVRRPCERSDNSGEGENLSTRRPPYAAAGGMGALEDGVSQQSTAGVGQRKASATTLLPR